METVASRPSTPRRAAVVSMSWRPGTLRSRLSPSERSVAHRMGRAAFLAPLTRIVPSSFRAPRRRMASMSKSCLLRRRPSRVRSARGTSTLPRMLRVRSTVLRFAGATALLAGQALAEPPVPSVDLRGFRPPTHPESLLSVEPTTSPAPGDWNVGSWFSYAYRPIVVRDAFRDEDVPVIEHQLSLDLVGSIGVADRLGVGVSLPVVLAQSGAEPPPSLGMSGAPPTTALGDVAVDARATL